MAWIIFNPAHNYHALICNWLCTQVLRWNSTLAIPINSDPIGWLWRAVSGPHLYFINTSFLTQMIYIIRCVMALIRGLNSACPCPICLVPREELTDHSTTYPKCTVKDAQDCVELWSRDRIAGEAELKKQSLRPIKVRCWYVFLTYMISQPSECILESQVVQPAWCALAGSATCLS